MTTQEKTFNEKFDYRFVAIRVDEGGAEILLDEFSTTAKPSTVKSFFRSEISRVIGEIEDILIVRKGSVNVDRDGIAIWDIEDKIATLKKEYELLK